MGQRIIVDILVHREGKLKKLAFSEKLSRKSIRPRSWTALLFLGLFCFLVYNANLRTIGAGDTFPARYLPLIVWHNHTLDLDANERLVAHGYPVLDQPVGADSKIPYLPQAYWVFRTHRHQLASFYPVVTPLLVAPLYLPAVIWLNAQGWEQPELDRVAELMEKISASFLASIATILMYLVLRRDGTQWSLPLTLVFAFGTNTWVISSQALWQHGTGELLIALALFLVTASTSPARITLLGTVCVLMAANRPPDALIAGAIILFTMWKRRRNAWWLLIGAAAPLAAILYYNLNFIGHIAGAYALVKVPQSFFQPIWSGLSGLLVSPTRGLLVFSPFLIFIPVGLAQRLRSPRSRGLAVALTFAVAAQILFYSHGDWRAGCSWGPRWLTDILPILVWMLAPAPRVLRLPARSLLILFMVASISVQTIGAFWYTWASDELIFAGDPKSISMQGAWNPQNIPFLVELRHPPVRGDLLCNADGAINRIGARLHPSNGTLPHLASGAMLEGWALTCRRTPSQMLMLIDGIVIGSTNDFIARGDVNEVMHTTSPSGWRISATTLGVSLGERVLQLAVRVEPASDIRIVREQPVFVIAQESAIGSDLEMMAKRATELLQERQSKEGFWLTAYTSGLHYEAPQQEMNTFLTSMLVDLLSPVAPQRGLDDAVKRARQHLAAQIESNGLVRYHGLPDGSTIGKLGHIITPDADDTALVWRIAGLVTDDPRQQRMLEELARYRDARGLYRTWLAPQQEYQSIDPGSNPNPTDIGIQMNVYLMLRELAPPSAQHLCNAIQRSSGNEDIWVYYSKAPLVPYLRSAELRQLGCAVLLPTERLAISVAGQGKWSEAMRLLAETMASPPNENAKQVIRNLLVSIGSNDFAQLRDSPPMLYHNDMSATVKRFYWSEDFGYALWLRLYQASIIKTEYLNQP